MVSTSPLSRITTPLPTRRVPSALAVKASSGTVARTATTERETFSMVIGRSCITGLFYRYGRWGQAQGLAPTLPSPRGDTLSTREKGKRRTGTNISSTKIEPFSLTDAQPHLNLSSSSASAPRTARPRDEPVHPAESLDLEQAEWRHLRLDQPAGRRPDA